MKHIKTHESFIKRILDGNLYKFALVFVNFLNKIYPKLNCFLIKNNENYEIVSKNNKLISVSTMYNYYMDYTNKVLSFKLFEENISKDIIDFIYANFNIDDSMTIEKIFSFDINNTNSMIRKLTIEKFEDFLINYNSKKYNI